MDKTSPVITKFFIDRATDALQWNVFLSLPVMIIDTYLPS